MKHVVLSNILRSMIAIFAPIKNKWIYQPTMNDFMSFFAYFINGMPFVYNIEINDFFHVKGVLKKKKEKKKILVGSYACERDMFGLYKFLLDR